MTVPIAALQWYRLQRYNGTDYSATHGTDSALSSYKGLKLSERSWTCPECGKHHDRDLNAACNIKEFGLKALPTERGKVKPVDCPTVDERPRVLRSRGSKKQEKRGGIGISEAAKSLV